MRLAGHTHSSSHTALLHKIADRSCAPRDDHKADRPAFYPGAVASSNISSAMILVALHVTGLESQKDSYAAVSFSLASASAC